MELQVFMSALDIKQVEESIDTALHEINTKSVSQLIIAFPPDDKLVIFFSFSKTVLISVRQNLLQFLDYRSYF